MTILNAETYTVRRAGPADVAACYAILWSASVKDVGPLGRVSWRHPRVERVVADDAAEGRLYVVEGDGKLPVASDGKLAVATFAICDQPDDYFSAIAWAEPHAPARYLHRIAVVAERHGQGLGSWSLAQAEALAAMQGAEYLRLDTLQKDEPAMRFYRRHRYSERGVVHVPSDDPAQPLIPLACFERAV
jgi:GNAT superfamily N-acetyltransferase